MVVDQIMIPMWVSGVRSMRKSNFSNFFSVCGINFQLFSTEFIVAAQFIK